MKHFDSFPKKLVAQFRALPLSAAITAVVLTLGSTGLLLSLSKNELPKSIGSNLIADAVVLLLTLFLLEKLIQRDTERRSKPRHVIVYWETQSIYRLALLLWGDLLYIATQPANPEAADFDTQRTGFENLVGQDPFAKQSLEVMKNVGFNIARSPFRERILANLQSDARTVRNKIESCLQAHASVLDARQYAALRHLRDSALLRYCGDIYNVKLPSLGNNIVFTQEQHRDLLESFVSSHRRGDQRAVDNLPQGEDWDINHIYLTLADAIDECATRLHERELVLMPRTLDFMDHAFRASIRHAPAVPT
jgi:hypothetical protein